MSNTQVETLLADEPPDIQAEIIRINTEARHQALRLALLVPLIAAVMGLMMAFRMIRQPDPVSSSAAEGLAFG